MKVSALSTLYNIHFTKPTLQHTLYNTKVCYYFTTNFIVTNIFGPEQSVGVPAPIQRRFSTADTMSSRSPNAPFKMEEIYWGEIRREFTENILKANGDFLVRHSTSGDGMVLSLSWNGRILHYQPMYDGKVYSFGIKSFKSFEALLLHHFANNIPMGGDIPALLKNPVKKRKTMFKLSEIEILGRLGEGNFGDVYKVRLKEDGAVAAMKTLKENVPKAARETFAKELGLMQTMDHANVVKCLGVIDEGDGQLRILLELINKGSLEKLIRNSKLTNRGKARIILDVAKGMQYLHKMGVMHRDLAARNILVHRNADGTVVGKVSDFGLSRHDESGRGYELKSTAKLPLKWLAPECFRHKRWTKASDVWSFGVLMGEVFTNGAEPYCDVPEAQGQNLSRYISNGGHPHRPADCREDMWALMEKIFNPDDSTRITMDDVLAEVQRIYEVIKQEEQTTSRPPGQ